MSYQDRIKEQITLTSPLGDVFTAKWAGNNRSVSKKLGIFNAPKVNGSIVQDLDSEADKWPLTVYFDGEDHDIEAERFVDSLKQSGTWEIEHPTKGLKILQLVDFTEYIQPVEEGGHTRFATNWIEPLIPGSVVSTSQLGKEVERSTFLSNISAAGQFVANTVQNTVGEIRSISVAASRVLTNIRTTLRTIENFEIVPAEFDALVRGIQATVNESPIDTSLLAGQIQGLVQLFAPTATSSTDGVAGYNQFLDSMSGERPIDPTVQGSNQVAVQELVLAAANAAVANALLVGGEKTRREAVVNAESILDYFKSVTDTLDITQELYKNEDIDQQYFSQSESYYDSLNLVTVAAAYKLRASFDLAIEKRFTLDRAKSPIRVTIEEYEDVERLDEFIEINELVGDKIYLLPAGEEVVVYI